MTPATSTERSKKHRAKRSAKFAAKGWVSPAELIRAMAGGIIEIPEKPTSTNGHLVKSD